MIESLVGTLFGGLFRMAPEILKWMDRKDERKHELSMFDKQLEADRQRAEQAQQLAETQGNTSVGLAEIQALIEGTKAQAVQTGIKFIDGFSAAIRPLMALQWLIILWPAVIVAGFIIAVQHGTDVLLALQGAFGKEEKAMASSIASFWLVDRSLRSK